MEDRNNAEIEILRKIIEESNDIVGFTGAGISTESGISDYRSKGGIWDRFTPIYFQEFLREEEKRIEYWKRRMEMWPSIRDAKPNKGHLFFKTLYDRGKLLGIITQNIDGLHERSGVPEDRLVNIHGTGLYTRCLGCNKRVLSEDVARTIDLDGVGAPRCGECGGFLKPDTISFGQELRPEELERAREYSLSCDAMICFGSTLIVYPAASFPELAKRNGATLAIVTQSETPLDSVADVVIREKIGSVVEQFSS
jgi:NAD-dependent deacetylase